MFLVSTTLYIWRSIHWWTTFIKAKR